MTSAAGSDNATHNATGDGRWPSPLSTRTAAALEVGDPGGGIGAPARMPADALDASTVVAAAPPGPAVLDGAPSVASV